MLQQMFTVIIIHQIFFIRYCWCQWQKAVYLGPFQDRVSVSFFSNDGEIPNLFSKTDFCHIYEKCQPHCKTGCLTPVQDFDICKNICTQGIVTQDMMDPLFSKREAPISILVQFGISLNPLFSVGQGNTSTYTTLESFSFLGAFKCTSIMVVS